MVSKQLQADDLIEFASSLPAEMLTEIEKFWSLGQRFKSQGFLHRRGYLLHGPQGSGKSSVVHQVVRHVINAGHVAFFCEVPEVFVLALQQFRKVEPDRPIVCVFEDIDAIIEAHDESALLQCLDGSHQVDKVINIATTNYPEKLDRRLVSRPRRFDRIIRIEEPSSRMREAYFRQKLPDLKPAEVARWIRLTEGLSFAGLVETVVSVTCLGNDLEETVHMLQDMETRGPKSRDYRGRTIGFRCVPGSSDEESED
jgi:SpoVK/Ycf46/Vps4 family AAA+-type ATPase